MTVSSWRTGFSQCSKLWKQRQRRHRKQPTVRQFKRQAQPDNHDIFDYGLDYFDNLDNPDYGFLKNRLLPFFLYNFAVENDCFTSKIV